MQILMWKHSPFKILAQYFKKNHSNGQNKTRLSCEFPTSAKRVIFVIKKREKRIHFYSFLLKSYLEHFWSVEDFNICKSKHLLCFSEPKRKGHLEDTADTKSKFWLPNSLTQGYLTNFSRLKCHEFFRANIPFGEEKRLHCIWIALQILCVMSQKNSPSLYLLLGLSSLVLLVEWLSFQNTGCNSQARKAH